MKLTINAEALERLIGGDSDIEIEIRQQIADQFCKRHLKSLINTETMKLSMFKAMRSTGICTIAPGGACILCPSSSATA